MSDELDALFAHAMQNMRAQQKAKELRERATPRRKTAATLSPPETAARYTNPDNWHTTRIVALIHDETKTLLGNFQEFIHNDEAGTRRLVLTTEPVAAAAIETVSGDWWIAKHHEIAPPERWHTTQRIIIPVTLDKLGVQSPLCELTIHLAHGNIVRVTLDVETQFAQIGDAPAQLLWFPAGTNILPVMAFDSKLAIRTSLDAWAAKTGDAE